MPTPPLPQEKLLEALDAWKRHGTQAEAARSLGLNHKTYCDRLTRARHEFGVKNKDDVPTKTVAPTVEYKPVYRISAPTVDGRGKTKVCAIGDAHDSPFVDKARFRWIGRHIEQEKHDIVVQIGDFSSLDSLCKYEPNDTLKGKQKPPYKDDMLSFKQAADELGEGMGNYRPERRCTLGNHEDRVHSFIDRTPEIVSALADTPHTILTDRGWSVSPYGAFNFIGQTAFVHVPLNRMGKPYGGVYSQNQIARDALFDVVYGHTHVPGVFPYPKLNHQKLTIVNLGCALPDNHIERYAQHSLTGWDYGIFDLTLEGGRISRADWKPMSWLEETYG